MKLSCFFAILLPTLAFAQNPAEQKPNLLKNGDFQECTSEDNLWDGVDSDGFLCGDVSQYMRGKGETRGVFFQKNSGQADAILEGGNVGRLGLPISVQVADLNKDGLLDLFTVDGAGYFRVYFNSGTPTEPKFTQAETVPLFLVSRINTKGYPEIVAEGAFKACFADFDKRGMQDLIIGTYLGQVLQIKNTGSAQVPEWRQPPNLESIAIPTARDGHRWANLLSPAVYDWNKDGKPDLLLGEGSYSANAVHLFLNTGSFGAPQFSEDARDYLAYGDGREQLVPAVVDYNGDGFPDLLVGDRLGNIWVYLSEGPWKKGAELKRMDTPISFGGVTQVGGGDNKPGCVHPAIADLNGDGKFDIIVGRANGHIAVSYNIGTNTEPKFGPLVDLKGEKVFKMGSIRDPKEWVSNFGYNQGNILGYYSTVTPEEDPEAAPTASKHVLKFAYDKNLNKVIRKPPMMIPGIAFCAPKYDFPTGQAFFINNKPGFWGEGMGRAGGLWCDSNMAILRQSIDPGVLKPNTNYMLSFKVKGRGVKAGHTALLLGGWLVRDAAKAEKSALPPNMLVCDFAQQELTFNVTPAWTVVSKPVSFKFQKSPELNDPGKIDQSNSKLEYRGLLDIRAAVNVDDGVFYIDDVRLTPM